MMILAQRTLLATSCLALLAAPGRASKIVHVVDDTTEKITVTVVGGALDSDDSHELPFGVFWPTSLTITEDAGSIYDTLRFRQTTVHAKPPHGEGAGPNIFLDSYVSAYDLSKGDHEGWGGLGIVKHGDHWDAYNMTIAINVAGGLLWDISGWTMKFVARHSEHYLFPIGCSMSGQNQNPPVATAAFGTGSMLVDAGGTFELGISVANLAPRDILAARIHLGRPGESGPPIVNLGSQWYDVGGAGAGLDVQGQIPAQYYQALQAGYTYLNVETTRFPTGEVRGQLELRTRHSCDKTNAKRLR